MLNKADCRKCLYARVVRSGRVNIDQLEVSCDALEQDFDIEVDRINNGTFLCSSYTPDAEEEGSS